MALVISGTESDSVLPEDAEVVMHDLDLTAVGLAKNNPSLTAVCWTGPRSMYG